MDAAVVRRVTREQLRTNIYVALTVLKPYQQRALGLNIDRIRNDVTDDLVQRIMGRPESETALLQPDLVGSVHSPKVGVWGVDEQHPFPDTPPPLPPS